MSAPVTAFTISETGNLVLPLDTDSRIIEWHRFNFSTIAAAIIS